MLKACDAGVSIVHTVQHTGEFMVTFPAAFHAGFSHGFNCAEAVNIADATWLPHGRAAVENYRSGAGAHSLLWRSCAAAMRRAERRSCVAQASALRSLHTSSWSGFCISAAGAQAHTVGAVRG